MVKTDGTTHKEMGINTTGTIMASTELGDKPDERTAGGSAHCEPYFAAVEDAADANTYKGVRHIGQVEFHGLDLPDVTYGT